MGSNSAARILRRYRHGSLFRGPLRVFLDPDGTVTSQALERLLRRAGIEAVGVELTNSSYLPHNVLLWSSIDVHGTPLGGMLAFDLQLDHDRVEIVAELEVLDPKPSPEHVNRR